MSASSGFGSYEAARKIVAGVTANAVKEVAKENPPTKTAIVTQINMPERWAMVIYTGEVTAVKVPFADAAPSYTGQHVVIGGNVSDRHIVEVIGKTYSEDAVDELSPCLAEIYLQSNTPTNPATVVATDPTSGPGFPVKLNVDTVPPLGCTTSEGVITVNVNGIFEFLMQLHASGTNKSITYHYKVVKVTPEGVKTTLMQKEWIYRITGGGGEGGSSASGQLTRVMTMSILGSLVAGDKVWAEAVSGNTTAWGAKTSLRIHKIGPFEEAAALPEIPDQE